MTNSSPSTLEKARSWSATNGLYRSTNNRRIKGICGGLSEKYNVDPSIVRIGFVILTLVLMAKVSGWFFLSYAIAMILIGNRSNVGANPSTITFNSTSTPAPAPSGVPTAADWTTSMPTAVPAPPTAAMPIPVLVSPTSPTTDSPTSVSWPTPPTPPVAPTPLAPPVTVLDSAMPTPAMPLPTPPNPIVSSGEPDPAATNAWAMPATSQEPGSVAPVESAEPAESSEATNSENGETK